MLTKEQRQEIFAVGLLALALFVLLSLIPVSILGERGLAWFDSGNMVGVVGATVKTLLTAFFTFGGLRFGGWLSEDWMMRLTVFTAGLLVLVPLGTWIVFATPAGAGWLGVNLGSPLMGLVGWLGALLVTSVGLVVLSVGSLGWNPLRSVGRGVMAGSDTAARTAKALAEKGKELAEARAQAKAARADEVAEAVPGMEPEWLGADDGASEEAADDDDADVVPEEDEGAGEVHASVDEPSDEADAGDDDIESLEGSDVDERVVEAEVDGEPSADILVADEDDEHDDALATPEPVEHEVPPMDLLSEPEGRDRDTMDRQLDELGKVLVEKLKSFNVECSLGGRTSGPMVTQFEVVPHTGVKVNRIANLDADLALAMKAKSVRIVAPIPGKGAVGVEIPNPEPEIVNLREVLEAPEFKNAKGDLPLALGKDLTGKPYVANLAKMPHVLIAGATGSGKSVCLNTIVTSLVYRHTPETLRLLMIDPKMVELSVYSRLPHLRHNVVTDPRDAAGVLKWAVIEMERRYGLLKVNHVRSIAEFNKKVRDGKLLKRVEPEGPEGDEDRWIYTDGVMPYIVVVVDELADLMMTVQSEVEKPLTQLAQKARAIGIHLIVATQRPSVNVITGLIKANFPTRIAFRVASKTDSRTILDMNGADALLGNGDMLFLPPGQSDPVRLQGAYLPTEDTERLMGWYVELLERHGDKVEVPTVALETDILEELRYNEQDEAAAAAEEITGEWDELFKAAAEVCIQNGSGSTSLLQRRLSIGYGRAARIVDQLHDAGVIGPQEGSKGREVLMSLGDIDAMFDPGSS